MSTLFTYVATYGPIGYYRGSGTLATVATMPFVVFLRYVTPSIWAQLGFILFMSIGAFYVVQRALHSFSEPDPSAIVIDEGVGICIALSAFKPTVFVFAAGFILFRCFDIWKPCGIKHLEALPGAWGVMCDDIAAGLLSALVLYLCIKSMGL